MENPDGTLTFSIGRPLLGYPAVVYTDLENAETRLLGDAPLAAEEGRLAGLADPDVFRIRIDATVGSLEFDPENSPGPEPRRLLYSTFRAFSADPEQRLELTVEFKDERDVAMFPTPAATGSIKLPTARTIELTLTPIARRDPGMPADLADPAAAEIIDPVTLDQDDNKLVYLGKHAARVGARRTVIQRRESADETGLFEDVPAVPFQGVFLQPSPPNDAHLKDSNAAAGTRDQAPEGAIQRLARQLCLENHDLTLSGGAGRHMVFGASAGVRHILAPDHSTITFSDETRITAQWLMVIPLRLARDWAWDALNDEGLRVLRSIDGGARELAGVISLRKTLNTTAVRRGIALERSFTDLFFFDAIDPKPAPGEFPSEIEVTYIILPQFVI